ncbi:MAG: DUF72 domain-containing protein [Deltaproteobacteria bacterium]|nr:DUF72 domain-containing protein [Deltaproteobacteria bacterium]MBW2069839.1 DUF72 domain-containing protein [Deltaproteobacteria bacterium]
MAEIRIGTSGWFYRHWTGRFYPPDLKPSAWLSYYASQFDVVENNSSFYHLPKESTVAGWYRKVPATFRYAVKMSRFVSHVRKLRDVAEPCATFLQRTAGLADKLAVVLVQLPPSFHCDVELLSSFLEQLPESPRFAFEFRHDSWYCQEALTLLSRSNCALCLGHSSRFPAQQTQTANFAYIRFHGPGRLYASNYPDQELSAWARIIEELAAAGRDVYAFFNNDFNAYAVENARTLRTMIFGTADTDR